MKVSFVAFEDENLGVEYLAGVLEKHGHQVDLVFQPNSFNRAFLRSKWLSDYFNWDRLNLEQLKVQAPDLIAFSTVTATYKLAQRFVQMVREAFPNTPIVFGGPHVTVVPELVFENPEVDMACVGEGEEALLELVESLEAGEQRTDIANIWFRNGEEIIKNGPRELNPNLDDFPAPRELFLSRLPANYRKDAYYLSARGCPYRCTFCGNEQKLVLYKGLGRFVRQKSVERVIDDLIEMKARGTESLLFVDDIFTMNKKWLREFVPQYKEKVGLPFTCFIHSKKFNRELGELLKEGGCRLAWFGIQTGDEQIRRDVLVRLERNSDIIEAAEICRDLDMPFMVDHIFDIPYDTDVMASAKLYNEIRPAMINCYNLLYFPESPLFHTAVEAGLMQPEAIEKINRGDTLIYQTGGGGEDDGIKRDNYRDYALLLTLIPLLPKHWIDWFIQSPKAQQWLSRRSTKWIPWIKVLLNFKVGHGFIPLAVIKTEIFWVFEFLRTQKRVRHQAKNPPPSSGNQTDSQHSEQAA